MHPTIMLMELVLNRELLESALKERGYRSLSELAADLDLHRNTISQYFNGKSVLPEAVVRVLERLRVRPLLVLRERTTGISTEESLAMIASLVTKLVNVFPNYAFFLFGSRARGDARKYSDVDIGILAQSPLSISDLSKVREVTDTISEDFPVLVDLLDVARAAPKFLSTIRKDAVFLGGDLKLWTEFKNTRQVNERYEGK